jgi:integrase
MAIGESRREAKQAIREERGPAWSVSTGRIHSFKTRSVYQEHSLKFVTWARDTHGVKHLEDLDVRSGDLAAEWLRKHVDEGKSPSTLKTERAALRMFFDTRSLAGEVVLPERAREGITRSRGAVAHDRHFQPKNWQPLLNFLRSTGLRRQELRDLKCRDVYRGHDGHVYVHVENGKGGRSREVQALPGHDSEVWTLRRDRPEDAKVAEQIPKHLDVHSYRREFAQALYRHYAPGRELPSPVGRLRRQDYDRAAAQRVSWALGHNRIDVVLRHYIR